MRRTRNRAETIRWTASSGDAVWLSLLLGDSTGSTVAQQLICVVEDDGEFTIPGALWTSWSSGRNMNIAIGRYVESSAPIPYNDSESRVGSISWMVGAANSI